MEKFMIYFFAKVNESLLKTQLNVIRQIKPIPITLFVRIPEIHATLILYHNE
jgi:hypothetical protein